MYPTKPNKLTARFTRVDLQKLSVNMAEKINIPRHSDSHCRCMGSMIWSTSVCVVYTYHMKSAPIGKQLSLTPCHAACIVKITGKEPQSSLKHGTLAYWLVHRLKLRFFIYECKWNDRSQIPSCMESMTKILHYLTTSNHHLSLLVIHRLSYNSTVAPNIYITACYLIKFVEHRAK